MEHPVPMTQTQTFPTPTVGDPRFDFAHVASVAGRLIAETPDDAMGRPTPCSDYDVERLTGHLVAVMQRIAAVGQGDDPFSVPRESPRTEQGFHADWLEAAHDVMNVWADPAILDRLIKVPFGEFPGAATITFYCGELAVHSWDLAVATDRVVEFDDERLASALQAVRHGIPAEGRDAEEMPFSVVVPVAEDAPVVDQLAGWMGHRWPAAS